jgi:hypothetical protein
LLLVAAERLMVEALKVQVAAVLVVTLHLRKLQFLLQPTQ